MTTWIKVYNSMPQNPKLLAAGERAAWLYVCGLCYSNEHLTNGFIPRHALPVVAPGVKRPETVATGLVLAGLWHKAEGGWSIHHYDEHQRSAEEIRGRRAKDSARKAAERSNGSPHGQTADSARSPQGNLVESSRGRDRAPSQDVDVDVDVDVEQRKTHPVAELRSAVIECFAYWQERCDHRQAQLDPKRRRNIEGRLKDRQQHHHGDLSRAILDIRQAIDGAAIAAFVDERGKRHDDIELICRNVAKLEDFMGRVHAKPLAVVKGMSALDEKRLTAANRLIGGNGA